MISLLAGWTKLAALWRVRGEILASRGAASDEAEAEACLQRALALARDQDALLWELRTALALSRLCEKRGGRPDRAAGCQLLSDVYDRFTEGFDQPDLVAAQAQIANLRSALD